MKSLIALILTALVIITSYPQDKSEKKNEMFNLDVLNFYSTEGTKSRVDIYVEVPLGNLEFKRSKKDRTVFVSKFDLVIDVKDNEDKLVYNNVSKEEITTRETGQEYLSQNSQILTRNLFLAPGEYDLTVSINERSTQKFSEAERKINVHDYASKPLSISDIMIVSRMTQSTDKKVITPDVARNVANIDTFYIFYYIYNSNAEEVIEVNCKVYNNENREVLSRTEVLIAEQPNSFQNQLFMGFPTDGLGYGKYTIEISAAGKEHSVKEQSSFVYKDITFPLPLSNIEELILQLQYIAKDDEIRFMQNGNTPEEKQKRFLDFWKKKDPNPNTRRNEVMQEYYRRLVIANKSFASSVDPGWRTDMGMVFIIFGEPSNIDRHPFDLDTKPYEVWQYYDINKEFVFVDNTGFGDYRLITPIWETFRYQR